MTPDNQKDSASDLLRELENLQRVLDDAAGEHISHGREIPVLDPMDDIPVLDDLFTGDDTPVLKAVPKASITHLPLQKSTPAPTEKRKLHPVEEAIAAARELANRASRMAQANSSDKPAQIITPAAFASTAPVTEAPAFHQTPFAAEVPAAALAEIPAAPSAPATPAAEAAPRKQSSNPFLPQAILDRLAQEREAAQHSAEEAHRTMQKVMEQKQKRVEAGVGDLGNRLSNAQKERIVEQLVAEMLPDITEKLKDRLRNMLK